MFNKQKFLNWNVLHPIKKLPSNFSDIYFTTIWGEDFEHKEEFFEVFGCPNGENGETVECRDAFAKWYNSMFWNCNTRPELLRIKIIFSSSYSIR